MNSIKIKSKSFFTHNGQSIAAIVVLPEENKLRVYVAWENEPAALNGFIGFFKNENLYSSVTTEIIEETMAFGRDVSHLSETRKIFKSLF